MDEVLTYTFYDGQVTECFCSHCRVPWFKAWVYCPICEPVKYAEFERRRTTPRPPAPKKDKP